ncbi:MAG: hypothetical protein WCV88_05645 [Patescibacteria group bacterium]|jgi:hypothetical protein
MKQTLRLLLLLAILPGCTVVDQFKTPANHVVIVAGYGSTVAENASYQGYIQAVADYVTNPDNKVNTLIFTGSYTDNKDKSEAEAMNAYFNKITDLSGVKVLKEECAIVSWQNISYSHDLLLANNFSATQVTLFGDKNRTDKLQTFAVYLFNLGSGLPDSASSLVKRSINTVSVDTQGYDFGVSKDSQEEQDAKFASEILGAYDANAGNKLLQKRLTEWSNNYGYDVADNLVKHGCTQYAGF